MGAATIVGRCYEGEAGLAFSPFIQALRASLDDPMLREAAGQFGRCLARRDVSRVARDGCATAGSL